ncbi:Nif3-like dinuclear metal center hexameric protein [Escherichia coli]|nr:Nif3-like dinuclear metal center hexameric protein [Escherichia coli]
MGKTLPRDVEIILLLMKHVKDVECIILKQPQILIVFLNSMVAVSQPTVDKIIFGAEATRINKIGTCWIASMDVLRKAVFEGVNIIITHEPTFYSYADLEGEDLEFSWARKVMGYTHGELSYLKIIEQKKGVYA